MRQECDHLQFPVANDMQNGVSGLHRCAESHQKPSAKRGSERRTRIWCTGRRAEFCRNEVIRNACGNKRNHDQLLSNFQDILINYDSKHVLNTNVLCLSEHAAEDSGGLGTAIVIDTGKLNAPPSSPLIISKVRYGTKAQRFKWIIDHLSRRNEISGDTVIICSFD